jgi:hypothetical protein
VTVSDKGTVTVGDLTLPIDDIYLSGGQIVLQCALPGGVGLVADHYDVYDRGGQLLYRCPRRFNLSPMPGGPHVLTFGLLINGQTAIPGQAVRTVL